MLFSNNSVHLSLYLSGGVSAAARSSHRPGPSLGRSFTLSGLKSSRAHVLRPDVLLISVHRYTLDWQVCRGFAVCFLTHLWCWHGLDPVKGFLSDHPDVCSLRNKGLFGWCKKEPARVWKAWAKLAWGQGSLPVHEPHRDGDRRLLTESPGQAERTGQAAALDSANSCVSSKSKFH